MKLRHCEMCSAAAAVYCFSDAAFLCRTCDAKVHGANFLVARHLRRSVCSNCRNFTGDEFSGVGSPPPHATCQSCSTASGADDGVVSTGYSSDCISSTTSPAKDHSGGRSSSAERWRGGGSRRADYTEAEGVFNEWCGRIGVAYADVAVPMACKGLRACFGNSTVVPYRVCLAASMWLGLRLGRNKSAATWQLLKRLEEVSGVPARVILGAELKLERALRGCRGVGLRWKRDGPSAEAAP